MKKTITSVLALIFAFWAAVSSAEVPATASDLGLMVGAPPEEGALVTLENFIVPPYNRWAFSNMRELVPTREVAASTEPSELAERPVDLSEVSVDLGDGPVSALDWVASAYTDGFIVLDRGVVVHEQYENDLKSDQPHIMFSVTKSLTGSVMLQLFEEGRVEADASISTYISELKDSAFGDATVQQVMDMTNSIAYDETYDDPESDIARFIAAFFPGGEGIYSHLGSLTDKTDGLEHGDAFHYVTPDPEVLGWIIRRVTGKTLAQNVQERIWGPMGAEYAAYYWVDSHGVEMAGGGISMTLRDAARFGQMILNDGEANGSQVFSAAIAQRIKTPRNQVVFNKYYEDDWYGEVAEDYHDQWWSYKNEDAVVALGIHGQFIYVNEEHDVVIAKLSSDPEAENDRVDSETPMVMHAIAEYLASIR